MIQVLHASHNGELYKRRVLSVDDIADLIRETSLETLTNTAGIDFWFTPLHAPSAPPSQPQRRRTPPGHNAIQRLERAADARHRRAGSP